MRRLRICIYGGTDLQGTPTDFISELAYQVLDSMPAVIVTGGFLHSNEKPTAISTDAAALRGARRFAAEHARDLSDCFEAWIPEPSLDDRQDVKGAVRMSASDGIAVRVMTGRTPLGRRLAMVRDVDLVVTISGRVHTEVVVEHALELGLPVLPIPDAGGDSADLLRQHRERIAASFDAGALDRCLGTVSLALGRMPSDHRRAAGAVIDLLKNAKVGRCLVLMPFNHTQDRLYESRIRPAVERHMTAIRLDRNPTSAPIYTSFASAIEAASALIADVTTLNENVMYEVGYAHGRGLEPLLVTRREARLAKLPIYFKTLNIRLASAATPVEGLIEDYLRSMKATRGLNPPSD